uniref:L-ascorbate peroxidase n=1 Tax=Mesembryanthemum crystallinum TaxID=3544 RepID=O81603_MESCR|nr:ascorbate peroxidase [Mesembryanthemum crystallinum]
MAAPKVDADYLKHIEGARKELRTIISTKQCAPLMLRLSFHDAGTYDAKTKKGGPNGTVRFELNNPANNGIKTAVDLVEQVKVKHPKVTYADLYQLAGVVAVEVTGGPVINFVPGRPDVQQVDSGSLPLPSGDANHLREVFHRMGLSDRDIVVLSGAHTLGRANRDRSGVDGPFTKNPLKFDNSYYVELLKGDTPELVKFNTDKVLLQDPTFRKYVQLYAKDEKAFLTHYAESHKKMSELGKPKHM